MKAKEIPSSQTNTHPSAKQRYSTPLNQRLRDLQHFGEEGGVVPAIDVGATSTFLNPEDMDKTFRGEHEGCYLYSRHSNPTVNIFGAKMAALEGSEAAIGLASGMSAIHATIKQIFINLARETDDHTQARGHMLSSSTVYGGTYALFAHLLPMDGIQTSFVNIQDEKELESKLQKDTRVLYVETLSNPLLRVADFRKLSQFAQKHQLLLVVDNTFAPVMINPLLHGADIVIHSCTKFISGASDMIAGAVCGSKEFISSLIDINYGAVMLMGPVMDARIAHELYLRLDHLPLRIENHSRVALSTARALEKSGYRVIYPGLESHPDHSIFKSYSNDPDLGFGGVLTLDCGTSEKAKILAQKLQDQKFGLYAVSLGFSRTLMSCPSLSTSSEIPEEMQLKMGLTNGLLRMSMGYTGQAEIMLEKLLSCAKEILK